MALLVTFVGKQGLVQELGSWPEMGGNVGVGKVVQLNTHVGDVHAWVEGLASVDASAMGSIEQVSDTHPLQPGLVDRHWPEGSPRKGWGDVKAYVNKKYNIYNLLFLELGVSCLLEKKHTNICIYKRSPGVTSMV